MKIDNKNKILECALELFSLRGYDGVGIKEIADSAGIGKPTLYHYYGNKEGLLNTLFQKFFNNLSDTLKEASNYKGDLTLSITNTVNAFFKYAEKNMIFYRMQLSMSFDAPESISFKSISPYKEKEFKIIEKLFLKASNDHGNMKGRHMQYAVSLLGIINTYIVLLINDRIEFTDELTHRVVHQFMHGIFS